MGTIVRHLVMRRAVCPGSGVVTSSEATPRASHATTLTKTIRHRPSFIAHTVLLRIEVRRKFVIIRVNYSILDRHYRS